MLPISGSPTSSQGESPIKRLQTNWTTVMLLFLDGWDVSVENDTFARELLTNFHSSFFFAEEVYHNLGWDQVCF